ncbi:MAG: hypothetical protein WC780_06220 [Lentimicrobiaceae bacterium]|jgi:hypothetical protein
MKKLMLLFVAIILSINVFSQDYQKELLEDIAVISEGKYTATDYTLLTLADGSTLQVKSYAEAPAANVISRDNFVTFFAYITIEVLNGMTEGQETTSTDLEEIIGNPDVEINCFMNKTGVQIEIKGPEGTNRITQKWSELMK